MMKMRIAAVLAAVMIGTAAVPAVTAFAQGNDPEQTAAVETTATEVAETSADTTTAESAENGNVNNEEDATEKADESEVGVDLSGIDLSKIPGLNLDDYADILADLDPEVVEVLLKNPKLLGLFLPTLHVTVTDTSVTVAVDGDEPEEEPYRTGHVRTNGSNLNVRTGPGIGFDIINSLANGTKVQVTKEENGWYQLEFPARYGYVCGKYLEMTDITPKDTPEGYTFDIDGEMMAGFLSLFSGMFEEEPQPVPDIHGLTPDGNLTLVDDIGPVSGEGQQFVTLVSKAGNVFYLIIDRDEKGEENVHFLNLVDERDLFTLMEEDDQNIYTEQLAAEQAAKEAAEKAAAEAAAKESEEGDAEKTDVKAGTGGKRNMLPLLLIPLLLAGAVGGWFYLQTKKKKQEENTPDPDADYTEDEDEEDYGAGEEAEVTADDVPDTDPYEDEILGDDDEEDL